MDPTDPEISGKCYGHKEAQGSEQGRSSRQERDLLGHRLRTGDSSASDYGRMVTAPTLSSERQQCRRLRTSGNTTNDYRSFWTLRRRLRTKSCSADESIFRTCDRTAVFERNYLHRRLRTTNWNYLLRRLRDERLLHRRFPGDKLKFVSTSTDESLQRCRLQTKALPSKDGLLIAFTSSDKNVNV